MDDDNLTATVTAGSAVNQDYKPHVESSSFVLRELSSIVRDVSVLGDGDKVSFAVHNTTAYAFHMRLDPLFRSLKFFTVSKIASYLCTD